jgi:hypothetical protein
MVPMENDLLSFGVMPYVLSLDCLCTHYSRTENALNSSGSQRDRSTQNEIYLIRPIVKVKLYDNSFLDPPLLLRKYRRGIIGDLRSACFIVCATIFPQFGQKYAVGLSGFPQFGQNDATSSPFRRRVESTSTNHFFCPL